MTNRTPKHKIHAYAADIVSDWEWPNGRRYSGKHPRMYKAEEVDRAINALCATLTAYAAWAEHKPGCTESADAPCSCGLTELEIDEVKARVQETVPARSASDDKDIYMFLGWLSVELSELHAIENGRLGEAYRKWRTQMGDTPQETTSRREYHALGTYWSGVPTVEIPCDFCGNPFTDHNPRTHECPPQDGVECVLRVEITSDTHEKVESFRRELCNLILDAPGAISTDVMVTIHDATGKTIRYD